MDYIIKADVGEIPFALFIEFLQGIRRVEEVPELAYRNNGEIRTNNDAALPRITLANRYNILDQVPLPNFSLYDGFHWRTYLERFQKTYPQILNAGADVTGVATIDIGRGCSRGKPREEETYPDEGATQRCNYCGIADLVLKFMSPSRAWEVVRTAKDQVGANFFYVTHDSFSSDRRFLRGFVDAKPRDIGDVYFMAYTQARETNAQLIELYKQIPIVIANLGLDHGNTEMIQRLKGKNDSREANESAIQMLSEAGIWMHASLVLGGPGENRKTLDDAVQFAEWALDNGLFVTFGAAPLYPELNAPFGKLIIDPAAARRYASRHGIKIQDENLLEDLSARLKEMDDIDSEELCEAWARIWTEVTYEKIVEVTLEIRQKVTARGKKTGGFTDTLKL